MTPGKTVVFAYQDIGYVCLEALLEAGAEVALVVTHEDDPGEEVWFRSVAKLAAGQGIPVHTPADPDTAETERLVTEARPDFIFSFYYRYLLGENLLAAASKGAYNLHGSLLPRYRGRAPVNWVLVNGETETGVTLHRMVKKPDAGAIMGQRAVPVAETDTVVELYRKMTAAAAGLVAEVWPELAAGRAREIPQDESRASYFGGRRPEDGRIDWGRPAKNVYDLVRAVTHPYPGAFTFWNGRKIFVWSASYEAEGCAGDSPGRVVGLDQGRGLGVQAGSGLVWITRANLEGGPELTGAELAGLGPAAGDRLEV